MTIGASIFLIVAGAILHFAVNVESSSINLDTIGVILMIAGAAGLVLSLFFWATASSRRAHMGEGGGTAESTTTTTRRY